MTALRIAFLLPYGERADGFFPDTFLGQLCADAREAGHDARIARVYYEGDGGDGDREVARRLEAWLDAGEFDVVVLERVFDIEPIRAFADRAGHRRCVLVARGDSIEPLDGIDVLVGAVRGVTATGKTRRAVTIWDVAESFGAVVADIASGRTIAATIAVEPARDPDRRLHPVLDQEVIAIGEAPRIVRRTLFGNAGCPYAADPLALPHYRGVTLPATGEVAALGCAFCSMGGDYERRADADTVAILVDQARHIMDNAPGTAELVLSDQNPLRYLGRLVRAAHAAGVPPVRWLFAARSDTFVRERGRVEAAIAAAVDTGHVVEVYLTGFETFSDAELLRYNKGVTAAEQIAAVGAMRALHAAHPEVFRYADARGHSLIMWNPWTTPGDIAETVSAVRRHGLGELFDDVGRNRLRLHPDLPIFHAAARDGALVDDWDPGDEGAARRKGYHAERPWRFLDARTRLAWELTQLLRDRLGRPTELAQLAAIAAHAASWSGATADVDGECRRVGAELDMLIATLSRLSGPDRDAADPPRGSQTRAAVARLTGDCNNGCRTCPNAERYLPDDAASVLSRVEAARGTGLPVVLAGREPSVHPAIRDLLTAAAGPARRPVGIVSNGRRFCYEPFARAAVALGLTGASIKLFAPTADIGDAICRDDGAHVQTVAGIRALIARRVAVEIRAPLHAANLAAAADYAFATRELGAQQLRIEIAIDAVGLGDLAATTRALRALVGRAARLELPVEASPLGAGSALFQWLPTVV